MCSSLSSLLSTCDVVECLVNFLSVEDALALACSSKCWRMAVNQEMIWRVLVRREGGENKPNYLRKEYRDYAEKYEDSNLDPLCEEAFVLVYPRFMERAWNDYVRQRCDNLGWGEQEHGGNESWWIDCPKKLKFHAEKLKAKLYFKIFIVPLIVFALFQYKLINLLLILTT
jgi:hypothetical protein